MTDHQLTVAKGNYASGKGHRVGVTSDEAENAPQLRVTYGEDSEESKPPFISPSRDTHRQGLN